MAPLFGVEGSAIQQQNVGGACVPWYARTYIPKSLPVNGAEMFSTPHNPSQVEEDNEDHTDSGTKATQDEDERTADRREGRGRGRRSSCSEHPIAATPPLCLPRTSASLVNKNSSSPADCTAKQDVDRMDSEWGTRNAHRHVHSVLPSSAVVLLFG